VEWSYCPYCGKELRFEQVRFGEPLRQVCSACGQIHYRNAKPSVSALILHNSRVLLMQRKQEPMKGQWDFPGGFLEEDEHPKQGIIRECAEEIGLLIEPFRIFGVYKGFYGGKEREHILNIVYVAQLVNDKVYSYAFDETLAVKWFPVEELPASLAFEHNTLALQDWRQQVARDLDNERALQRKIEAVLSAAGGWAVMDTETLKAQLRASRDIPGRPLPKL
jgi:ADP-ribose pyrophosphatase YjhB (NUDIX family)